MPIGTRSVSPFLQEMAAQSAPVPVVTTPKPLPTTPAKTQGVFMPGSGLPGAAAISKPAPTLLPSIPNGEATLGTANGHIMNPPKSSLPVSAPAKPPAMTEGEARQRMDAYAYMASELGRDPADMPEYQAAQKALQEAQVAAQLEEQRRRDAYHQELYNQRTGYEAVRGAADFDAMVEAGKNHGLGIFYLSNRAGKDAVRYITDPQYASARQLNALAGGAQDFEAANWNHMTDDEKKTVLYYAGQGDYGKVEEYLGTLERELNARRQGATSEHTRKVSEEHPFLGAAANIGASFATPVAYLANAGQMLKEKVTGEYEPTDTNSPWFSATHTVRDTAQGVSQAATRMPIFGDIEIAGKNLGSFIAETGLSMGQFLSKVPLGPTAALVMMGGGAAGQTTLDALERGGSNAEAFGLATVTGLIEIATEKIGLDNLLSLAKNGGAAGVKQVLLGIAGQMLAEGGEEAISEIAGNIADMAIMGDKSEYEQYVKQLMAEGMTRAQAEGKALTQFFVVNTAWSAAGGMASGGVTGTGGTAVGSVRTAVQQGQNKAAYMPGSPLYNAQDAQKNTAVETAESAQIEGAGKEQIISDENIERYRNDVDGVFTANDQNVIYTKNGEDIHQLLSQGRLMPVAMADDVFSNNPTIRHSGEVVNPQSMQNGGNNSDLPEGMGAMSNPYQYQEKQSRVGSNTFSRYFSDVLTEMKQDGGNVTDLTYSVVTEEQSMNRAAQRLHLDFDGEVQDLSNKRIWSGEDVDTAMGVLATYVNEARNSADYSKVNAWAKLIQSRGTEGGQMVQAFAKYTRTPEGILVRAADTMDKAGVDADTNQKVMDAVAEFAETLETVQTKEDLIDLIKRQAKERNTKVSKATEWALQKQDVQFLRNFALTQLENIALDYAKVSTGKKISTFQAIAHLLNLKTTNRNLVSNQTFDVIDTVANDVGVLPDAIMSLLTGRRTVGAEKSWLSQSKRQGAVEGLARGVAQAALDVNMGDATKYGTGGNRTNKMTGGLPTRALSTAEKAMGYTLNVTDEFHKGSVKGEVLESLARLVERGDITQQEADQFAEQEALYRSFQDETLVGTLLGQMKNALNLVGVGDSGKRIGKHVVHEFGLGDLVQKYTQVPGALITRAVEFSPVGYGKAILAMANAARNGGVQNMDAAAQRKAALAIGRATTGTGLVVAFAALAKAGLLRRAEDEGDKDIAALNAAEGIGGTQLNTSALARWIGGGSAEWQDGDVLTSVDFLEPLNALMSVGALIAQDDSDRNPAMKGLAASLEGTFNAILDTPTMQTFNSIYDTIRYHDDESDMPLWMEVPVEIAKSSATGFVPSVVRQTAQATDGVYRDTYSSQNPLVQGRDAFMNSIPGLRQTLPAKVTPFGEDKTYGGSGALNAANAFVLPGATNIYRQSDVSKELGRVRSDTGAGNIYPDRNAPNQVKHDKQTYELTAEEKDAYQRLRGQITHDLMQSMIDGASFDKATADEKATMLNQVVSYANDLAKRELLAARGVDYKSSQWEKAYAVTQAGIDFDVYLGYKRMLSDLSETLKASEANSKVRQAIMRDKQLTTEQKGLLDETLLSDGIYLPRDVKVDYGSTEAFQVTQMTEGAQKKWPTMKESFNMSPDVFGKVWSVYNQNGVAKADKLAAIRELGFTAIQANQIWSVLGK